MKRLLLTLTAVLLFNLAQAQLNNDVFESSGLVAFNKKGELDGEHNYKTILEFWEGNLKLTTIDGSIILYRLNCEQGESNECIITHIDGQFIPQLKGEESKVTFRSETKTIIIDQMGYSMYFKGIKRVKN